jgi:hypothetical protein
MLFSGIEFAKLSQSISQLRVSIFDFYSKKTALWPPPGLLFYWVRCGG